MGRQRRGRLASLIRRLRAGRARARRRPGPQLPGFAPADGWSEAARPEPHRVHLN